MGALRYYDIEFQATGFIGLTYVLEVTDEGVFTSFWEDAGPSEVTGMPAVYKVLGDYSGNGGNPPTWGAGTGQWRKGATLGGGTGGGSGDWDKNQN